MTHVYEALIAAATFVPVPVIAILLTQAWGRDVAFVLSAIALVGVARRAFRIEIRLSRDRIDIRNYWRDYSVQWDEVQRVDLGSVMSFPAVALVLKDGRVVSIQESSFSALPRSELLGKLRLFAPADVDVPLVLSR